MRVCIIPSFHHDIAYLKPEAEYTPACFDILDEALYILERYPQYAFSIEQAWLLEQYWAQRPHRREALVAFAREGRLTMAPGLYAVPDMNMLDGESLFMQAAIGREIVSETLGLEPRACLIADCWGHHAQVPQIMRQCGYDYYAFSRCMRRDVNASNYVWKGLDGTEIRTHWFPLGYAGIFFPNDRQKENAEELRYQEEGKSKAAILHLTERLARYCDENDAVRIIPSSFDMMYPSRKAPEIIEKLSGEADFPQTVFTSLERALDQIDWTVQPRADGEFESFLKGTFSTNIWIKQRNTESSTRLESLEIMASALNRSADFTPEWKLVLKQQFHDILCGTICDGAVRECRRDYDALDIMLEARRAGLAGQDAGEAAYFNPLPFERSVFYDVDGHAGTLRLPALGFAPLAALEPAQAQPCPSLPAAFENEWYQAEIDADGFIGSLIEKRTGQDIVLKTQRRERMVPFGGLVMQIDHGDGWETFESPISYIHEEEGYNYNLPDPYDRINLDSHRMVGPHMPAITKAAVVHRDSERMVVEQEGILRFWITQVRYTQRITFWQHKPRIDYHVDFPVESKGLRIRAAYPVNAPQGKVRHQIPYGVIERGEGLQPAQMFMDYCGKAGMALINHGLPANNTEEGIMMLTLFRSVAMEYKAESQLSYNLNENQSLDWAIYPHAPDMDDMIWKQALDFNTPPIQTVMPEAQGRFSLEGGLLSALRPTDDGFFMRVYEHLGRDGQITIGVPGHIAAYALADGLQRPTSQLERIQDGKITLPLRAFGVQGIRLYKQP